MVVMHLNETRSLNITCNRQSMTVTWLYEYCKIHVRSLKFKVPYKAVQVEA